MEKNKKKDEKFGSELLIKKYDLILNCAKKYLTGSFKHRAEDAAHNAYIKAASSLHTFNGDEKQFESWLKRIVFNCCKDEQRDNRQILSREGDMAEFTRLLIDEVSDEYDLDEAEKDRLWNVLKSLSEKNQKLIKCRTLWGWSLEETAEVTGIKWNQISVNHSRALNALREKLGVWHF